MYSNTTLVKVKWKIRKNTEGEIKNSNTTLVKVKFAKPKETLIM